MEEFQRLDGSPEGELPAKRGEGVSGGSVDVVGPLAVGAEVEAVVDDLVAGPQARQLPDDGDQDQAGARRPGADHDDPESLAPGLAGQADALGIAGPAQEGVGQPCEHQGPENAAHSVDREDIKAVIDLQPGLHQADGLEADIAAERPQEEARQGADEARSGRDGGQAGNDSGDKADQAGPAKAAVLDQGPDQARRGRRHVCGGEGRAGVGAGRQGAAAIESEPAHPQEAGPGHGHARIVRRRQVPGPAVPGSHRLRQDESADPRRGVDHQAPGIVLDPQGRHPASAPDPVADGSVDQDQPAGAEGQEAGELHPLDHGADHQGRRDDGEGHLEGEEDDLGRRPDDVASGQAHQADATEVADEGGGP
uniref:Uncharacterized protein n=1 Tax=uncultured bacterium CBNPD1 BAC clone 1664 TaxID=417310 RepID=B1N6N0_9BACT|nr:hypothetical protein [uncultured bacterium CBNPD1 BAC clone 1664]